MKMGVFSVSIPGKQKEKKYYFRYIVPDKQVTNWENGFFSPNFDNKDGGQLQESDM